MRFMLICFALLALVVAKSQQQSGRSKIQLIRNFDADSADYVQRYEAPAPARQPARTAQLAQPAPVSARFSRPAAPVRPASRPLPPPTIERRRFNVLLRTPGGFDETSGFAVSAGK